MSEFRLVIQTKIKFISYSYTALVNDQLKSLVLLQNQQKENYTLLMFRQVVDQLIYQTNVNNLLSVNDSLFFDFNLESFENNLLLHSVETKKLFLITY